MAKVAITVNGSAPSNIYPPMILGSAAAALGDEVIIFCCPGGAPTMVRGQLEKVTGKGLPDIVKLFDGILSLGGKVYVCELALENKDIRVEDLRPGVELIGATTFMSSVADATVTLSF